MVLFLTPHRANEGGPPADKDSAAAGGEACTATGECEQDRFPLGRVAPSEDGWLEPFLPALHL